MDKQQAAADIIASALPLIPFEGWSRRTLEQAALAAGYQTTDIIRVFPEGAAQAAEIFLRGADRAMAEALQLYPLAEMKIRERIATALQVKLELMQPHREAVRKALALLALPFYAHRALRLLYDTADTIWYAIGDTSTDFNFYTKRLTLAMVYASAQLYWLEDKSPGQADTQAFIGRRIDDVMAFERIKKRARGFWRKKAA